MYNNPNVNIADVQSVEDSFYIYGFHKIFLPVSFPRKEFVSGCTEPYWFPMYAFFLKFCLGTSI